MSRFDNRSKNQFIQDIKTSHKIEAEIAVRLCVSWHAKTGIWPELIPAGLDFTGEYVSQNNKVTCDPDFSIDGLFVEITRSNNECSRYFHEKKYKVDKCISNGHSMVFVNGFVQYKQPNFILLNHKQLEEFTNKSKSKYKDAVQPGHGKTGFTGKPAYRYDIYWFKDLWRPLPVLINNIPDEYKTILNLTS